MSSHLTSLSLLAIISSDGVRDTLERSSEFWFVCLLVSSAGVAIGCLLEIGETWSDFRKWLAARKDPEASEEDKSWNKPLAAMGLLLVILGVVGEGVFEAKISNADTALRAHDEKVLGDTIIQAGAASESAEKARIAAAGAVTEAKQAGIEAGRATTASGVAMLKASAVSATAAKAEKSAAGALTMAGDAKAQVATVQSNIAKVDEKYAPRTLSKIKRDILIEYLRKAPIKPKDPIEINFDLTASDGEAYGKEIASAINDPSTGWKANNPVAATGDGDKTGIFLIVRELESPPPGAIFLQQALMSAGIGGDGIHDPRLPVGSLQIKIIICRKN
jgi:hypothetical protein